VNAGFGRIGSGLFAQQFLDCAADAMYHVTSAL
jgi:hypothetical protein